MASSISADGEHRTAQAWTPQPRILRSGFGCAGRRRIPGSSLVRRARVLSHRGKGSESKRWRRRRWRSRWCATATRGRWWTSSTAPSHPMATSSSAPARDTHLLLTGGMEKTLRVYDMNRPDAPPRELDKSPGSVRTAAWLHSGQTILSSCTDMGGVRLWDVRTGKIVQTLETKASVTSAEVSQDGRFITTADGSSVKFWDANHFGLVKSYDMPCNVESASLEPKSGSKFVAGGEDLWVHVFDFFTGEEIVWGAPE